MCFSYNQTSIDFNTVNKRMYINEKTIKILHFEKIKTFNENDEAKSINVEYFFKNY